MKNHHVYWENSLFLWPCSIVNCEITRGYTRVSFYNNHIAMSILYVGATPTFHDLDQHLLAEIVFATSAVQQSSAEKKGPCGVM